MPHFFKYKHSLIGKARSFRKNMTDAERKLWSRLRNNQLGVYFRRQVPVGKYVVDFVSIKVKLVIEVDGSQHYTDQGISNGAKKDDYLRAQDLTVLRFSNYDVLRNTDNVVDHIWEYIHKKQF